MKNHVYAGGMELAQPYVSGGTTYVTWQHTDPATGSSFTTDTSRTFAAQKEIGTLGEDVTTPPPPYMPPVFFQPTLPVEYTGGPSNEFGIPNWYVNMAMASWDANQASNMHSIGRDDLAQEILAKNPNVGLAVRISGWGLKKPVEGTIFGEAAAGYLGRLRALMDAGLLQQVGGYGEVVGYKIGNAQPTGDKPATSGIVFTTAAIRDSIKDDAEISTADFAPSSDGSSYAATFSLGSDSRVCAGKPFSLSVRFRTGSSVTLRSSKDPRNRIDPGRDSQFIGQGGLQNEKPPYFFTRLIRQNPDNPGRTITVTAVGNDQFGPVSASAFVKIDCP